MSITPGVITSPNHPDDYPDNIDKTEHITVGSKEILRLEFTAFAVWVGGSIHICPTDFVRITDGDGTTLMDNSCGYSDPSSPWYFQPPIITSFTNTVEIYFHTNEKVATSGWSLVWTALVAGGCLTVTSSHSSSHNLPNEGFLRPSKLSASSCCSE